MVVDIGVNITIVRFDVFIKQLRNNVEVTISVFKIVTGEIVIVYGKLQFKVKIGGVEVLYVVLVVDILDKFIFGFDFFMVYGCFVDIGVGSLRIGVEEVFFYKLLVF